MSFKSDIEIAQEAVAQDIRDIAKKINLSEDDIELYGKYKAKIDYNVLDRTEDRKGKLILTTAINPTPAGEGKTTTSIGVADALAKLGKNVITALREPSMGPVFGIKGGAAGGGYAQVIPMEDINLHFTGDMHAIGAANNLLAAMLDNHVYQGNELNINPKRITWRRCVDMNDRQLRNVVDGLGKKVDGVTREDGFDITVASEIMATFCLSNNIGELKEKLGDIVVAYTYDGKPVTARDLGANGAMAAVLKDALKPNLVQTLEGTPAIIHGGPFANIAHGCNSIIATKMALHMSDYVVTEAGFGADLGAEKFLDIKCRKAGIRPDAVVIAVVAINRFPLDTEAELKLVEDKCNELGVNVALSEVWAKGGEGGLEVAKEVLKLIDQADNQFEYCYYDDMSIKDKLNAIATRIYGADGVDYTAEANKQIKELEDLGFGKLPVCVAKTQYSLSDDQTKLGRPSGFRINVREANVSAGAGFIVVLTGAIMKMPGLPTQPAALRIDVDEKGVISGLF